MNTTTMQHDAQETVSRTPAFAVVLFWLFVGVPLSWGVWSTLQKAMALFS
ncbi:hypothetical protein GCM10007205_06730 [Oxalicibacterium flavum]|uniref:Oxalate:formate antiporter n=1 Tax=Oxalicibacterium flavum TaxID=179467 RepID=A0A8J2UL67_9BURK|nr:oxalate:formate antiporter [Oxalicibacterium flavum]GGC00102.1 hypothetical protein GCM10007205_06730 [Oxalicibacterium flavum]